MANAGAGQMCLQVCHTTSALLNLTLILRPISLILRMVKMLVGIDAKFVYRYNDLRFHYKGARRHFQLESPEICQHYCG